MDDDGQVLMPTAEAAERAAAVMADINGVLIGQEHVLQQVLVCLLAGGHVLIEGVPGLGKTLLVRALAQTFAGRSSRIQFTPDLMPTDVSGHTLYDLKRGEFEVRRGPVFTNFLLADEINRAPAKTQAALLEVMQERQVTIEGESFAVDEPFMVLATQNPVEQDGTYPLPEAELDRFMMKVLMDYPEPAAEVALVHARTAGRLGDSLDVSELEARLTVDGVLALRAVCAAITVDEAVIDYAVRLCRGTREHAGVLLGAGPRGSIALVRAARAEALLAGRDFATPDDVKVVASPVLRHRLQLGPELEIEGVSADTVIGNVLAATDSPRA